MKESILVVEDNESLRDVLTAVLKSEGYLVDAYESAEAARKALITNEYHCILSDFKLPGMNGIEFLRKVRSDVGTVPFLIMTAFGTIDIAIEAIRAGANDFITKPFEPETLCQTIREFLDYKQILHRDSSGRVKPSRKFISHDPLMQKVLTQADKVARVDTSVLILGESGVGKELIARKIHEESPRADKPFVAVNCAAMPAELLESEFFGHESGAFTGATQRRVGVFELASDGTIFLDEVGDMNPALQVKLLRALQEGEMKRVGGTRTIRVNPRIIAATNVNIENALDSGLMREDFYYRLAVVTLNIPPLRHRARDLEPLINYFLEFYSVSTGREKPAITREAYDLLIRYPWPGNARELENVIERAMILSEDTIYPEHLGLDLQLDYVSLDEASSTLPEVAERATRNAEIHAILNTLEQTLGNKSKAAKKLGVSYKTLLNKIKQYELENTVSP